MQKPIAGKKPVSKQPVSSADRLAALRQRLGSVDLSSGGAGFWSPKEGRSTIRVLPGVGNMGVSFFQIVGKHEFPPDGKKHVYCPHLTSEKQLPCPVCDIISELKNGDKASKKLADALYPRRSFWMNVIVRGEEAKGPQIYTPGIKVFQSIVNLIQDPDYGDVTDVDSGFDLKLERTGTGLETQYQVTPKPKPTPLSDDADQTQEWLDAAKDLSFVEASANPEDDADTLKGHPVYVLPYDRIVKEYKLDEGMEVDDAEEDEEEDEPPARKPAPAAKRKPAPQPEPEEEDEEVEEDEEEAEEEEDEEPEPPARKPVKPAASNPKAEIERRVARRATGR